jgi:AraC-like DNA-binding protein
VTISQGSGFLQFSEARHKVGPGSVFILPPGCWHRYRPDPKIGWVEDWVELRGATLESWIAKGLLKPGVTQISLESPSWGWLKEIHSLCRAHSSGFRPAIAGLAMAYLAQVLAGAESSKTSDIILRARELLLTGLDVHVVAKQLGISYLTLYRHFKKTTGLGPKEYALKIRLAQAEDLISGSDMSIKQVAKRLGFHSASHLSLEYKKAHGVAPQMTRQASAANSGPKDIFSWRPEAL